MTQYTYHRLAEDRRDLKLPPFSRLLIHELEWLIPLKVQELVAYRSAQLLTWEDGSTIPVLVATDTRSDMACGYDARYFRDDWESEEIRRGAAIVSGL